MLAVVVSIIGVFLIATTVPLVVHDFGLFYDMHKNEAYLDLHQQKSKPNIENFLQKIVRRSTVFLRQHSFT